MSTEVIQPFTDELLESSIQNLPLEQNDDRIRLIDAWNLGSIHWAHTEDGNYAKRFLKPLVQNGIGYYIDNINAQSLILRLDDITLPLIAVKENYENSYVCSPYGHYIVYGRENIDLLMNPFLRIPFKLLLDGLGKIVREGHLNSVVYVNNWLFGVDLYPEGILSDHIPKILSCLTQRFPEQAIIFRSLNSMTNAPLMQALESHGFKLIPSRYVYLTDTKKESVFQTRIVKSDLKLLRETKYQIVDEKQLSIEDYPKICELYRLFYITQHSAFQPQFNQQFFQLVLKQGLLRFKILKKGESIVGVAGFFERVGVMYCPIFGYDKNDPEHTIIYRLLSTTLLLEARDKGWIFHQSAGASFYKKIRRAEGYMEYMAVYTRHLSYKQRASWSLLGSLINLASPFIKNY